MHDHGTEAGHETHNGRSRLKIAIIIVATIMIAEVIGGILSNSLALLGDAGHMLVDTLALGLSLFAITISARPATSSKTYGYHRVEIMAALANGVLLAFVAAYIFYEAYQRFSEPPSIRVPLMLLVAGIGLAANLAGIFLLRKVSHDNLNIKAAYWHILGDSISSIGVIVGGILISVTGLVIFDPIIAILIGCIILWGAVRLVRESVDILLEAVPKHINTEEVIGMLKGMTGVEEVHDVHIWTITSGIYALSAHLIIEDQSVSNSAEIVEAVNKEMRQRFNVTHTTLQLECERCESCPSGIICQVQRIGEQMVE